MSKNPLINALGASLYIFCIVSLLNILTTIDIESQASAEFFAPILMLSLLTLSVTVMAYIFGYNPITMYFNNKKEEAVKLFLQTVGIFGCITFLMLLIYFIVITL